MVGFSQELMSIDIFVPPDYFALRDPDRLSNDYPIPGPQEEREVMTVFGFNEMGEFE